MLNEKVKKLTIIFLIFIILRIYRYQLFPDLKMIFDLSQNKEFFWNEHYCEVVLKERNKLKIYKGK